MVLPLFLRFEGATNSFNRHFILRKHPGRTLERYVHVGAHHATRHPEQGRKGTGSTMSRTALRHLRFAAPLAFAAALGIGSLPALAQSAPAAMLTSCSAIHFDLANPGPGARVEQGTDLLTGVAMDKRASDGIGVDRVDFFLDSRDSGGINIGSASPTTIPGPFGPGSFQATVSFPNMVGGHDLVAYAHSSVTGQESIIAVPIVLGEDPSKVAEPTNLTTTQTCTGGGNLGGAVGSLAAPAAPGAAPAAAPSTPASMTGPAAAATMAMTPTMSTLTL